MSRSIRLGSVCATFEVRISIKSIKLCPKHDIIINISCSRFSQLYMYILYTCACTHNKQTVLYYKSVCWSRRVELLLGNFYYLYARTVRLLCIHPRPSNCWQAAHAVIVGTSFSFTFTTIYWQPKHSNNHRRERDRDRERGRMWYKGSPLSASTSPLTVM